MASKAAKTKHVESEAETPQAPATEKKAISKAKAAKAAIAKGYGKPIDAVKYIKEEFGIDMTPQHFSATKSNLNKKALAAEPATPAKPRPVRASHGDAVDHELLVAMEAMKPLVSSLGADKVKRLVDLLG